MKKIILGFVISAIVLVGGFFVLSNLFKSGTTQQTNNSSPQSSNRATDEATQPDEAVYCDVQKSSCGSYAKTENSGNLEVTVMAAGKPAANLEVDAALAPGAPHYYMRSTDSNGVAQFDDLPAGDYKIYFNLNNFPKEYDASQLGSTKVTQGVTAKTIITLKKK